MDFAALAGMLNGSEPRAPNVLGGGAAGSAGKNASASKGATPAELKVHADHMWKFLDELASSDPEAYQKFIQGQMEEVAAEKQRRAETEAMFTPVPAFVIYTRQTAPVERTVYLNICSSPQVPPLQTKDRQPAKGHEPMSEVLIPLSVGSLKEDTDGGRSVWTSDVVFHPSVVSRSTTDLSFKLFMLELALQHLEEDEKISLHRAYKFESPSKPYIGSGGRPQQQKTESELAREKFIAQMKSDREEKIKQMKTGKGAEIVMPSLAKTSAAKQQYEDESLRELKLRPDEPTNTGKEGAKPVKKKVLIEDLTPDQGEDESLKEPDVKPTPKIAAAKPDIALASTTNFNTAAASSPAPAAAAATTTTTAPAAASPSTSESAYTSKASSAISSGEFLSSLAAIPVDSGFNSWPYGSSSASMQSTESLASVTNKSKSVPTHSVAVDDGRLSVTIHLPAVLSVAEVEVDLSRTQLQLSSIEYALAITFPQAIDDSASTAKFVKKTHTLKITAPVA